MTRARAVGACMLAVFTTTAWAQVVPAGLTHRYSFAADANDSVGTAHGTLVGGATISDGAVVLDGASGYVNLPNNLVTGYTSVAIETWVTDAGSGAWGRIYDFGNSTGGEDFALGSSTQGTQYMFLTSRSGSGTLRGSYTVGGGGSAEQVVEWPGNALPAGVRHHVVWTSDANAQTAWLYLDGMLVGSNTAVTLTPSSFGPTVNDWLGRSQWNDPLFKGSIDEFRIYDLALTPLRIAIDFAAGADRLIPDPGPLQSLNLVVNVTMFPGTVQPTSVIANFANVTNVDLAGVPGVIFTSTDTNVLTVTADGRIAAVGSGIATITATYQGLSDTKAIQVVTQPQTLVHRYSFTTDASDSEGGADGTLQGGASVNAGTVVLNGSTAYIDLPNNLVSNLTSVSFEAWFTDAGSGTWARVWDLGNSSGGEGQQGGGTSYMFLAVPNGAGGVRGAYKLAGQSEQLVDYSVRPAVGARHHVVWAQDGPGRTAKLYLDGSLVSQNTAFTYTPTAIGATFNDWLGRSQYNDPYFNGFIDEFRIYTAALSAAEVAQNFQLGPDVSPQSGAVAITAQPASLTVTEQTPANFTVGFIGRRPVSFQWYRNGQPIPGATNADYRLDSPLPPDSGAVFAVALTNSVSSQTFWAVSQGASLVILPDTNPPVVVRALSVGTTNVQLVFSESLETASATNAANYTFTNGLAVYGASLSSDTLTVTLATAPLVLGSNYTLIINGLRDRAFTPNAIAPGTAVSFIASPYSSYDLGGSSPPGIITAAGNGFDLTAGGGNIGGTSDQCNFSYQPVTGDFDFQIRLEHLDAVTPWTKAGLMARETLDTGGCFAAAIITPQLQGSFFECRSVASGVAGTSGSFPAFPPTAWLRLRRAASLFTGYASYDGQTWTVLGSANLSLPATVLVGFTLASQANGTPATAEFRDVGPTASMTVGTISNPSEPPGPSSRRTPIVVSEIMYKAAARSDGRNLGFIELFNSNPWPEDISRWRLDGQVQFTFPSPTTIPGGGFLVVAAVPADLQAIYGLPTIFGPYTNSLKSSGLVQLYDDAGALLLDIDYNARPPWPAACDGAGHSLVLARPSYGEADPRAWDISDIVGGSPGGPEGFRPSPLRSVVLNEILAHTDPPEVDTIELYNHGNSPVDLSGCVLTDNPGTNKCVLPASTIIPPRGFLYLTEGQLGFALDAAGETIFFKNPDGSRVLDALGFDAQQNGVSFGRYPDGAPDWYRLTAKTFGTNNAAPLVSDVGINEIMYHPISGRDDEQYVELHNHGPTPLDLSGWKFVSGVSYTFPSNTIIASDAYLVVAANTARLFANYPQLNPTNTIGNFSGRLSGKGERLALSMPDTIVSTNASGLLLTNHIDIAVDEVTYGTGGRWGQWADGGGSSLELINDRADKRLAANWADSDETAKAQWTSVETTGVIDNGANYGSTIGYAQIGVLDVGESLVDNIEVVPGTSGANYATNPGFDQGMTGWSVQGDHSRSTIDANAGYPAGGPALHLRASGRMWSGANSAQVALTNTTLAAGQTATLRFKARWLKGWPEVLLRLNGNWLEATARLPVPANLGTPGLPNSRTVANAGPAIFSVTHAPSSPAGGQPVAVTARVSDPDGVSSLTLRYRVDPSVTYSDLPMTDDGFGGDEVAGDGLFSAIIPAQASGTTIAFIVVATDARGATSRFPALQNDFAPDRECVVRFGDPNPASSFGAYHLWLTQTNVNRWITLPVLSNEEMDGTMVVGNRIIYNMSARYAGSPYHQAYNSPYGNACHYSWSIPRDDLFLGASSLNEIHWPGNDIQNDTPTQNNNDPTLQRGQAANTFLRGLGVPWINRRYVTVYVNGRRRGTLMEDAQRPSISVGKEYFVGDTGGLLYKVQPWFEFGPSASGNYMPWNNKAWATILPYATTGGAYKTARYRWNYELRTTPDSMSNYTNLFTLISAASSGAQSNYVAAMQNLADMENWMRLVAANHAAGNWDCFGVQNGQNIYGYVSPQVRWSLFMFDFDIVLGNPISWGPGANMAGFYGSDANWTQIYATPTFNRMYWRALKELVNGAMLPANFNPPVEAKYAAFIADGVPAQNPSNIETWVAQARTSIASQVASRDTTAFVVTSTNLTATANAVTLSGVAPLDATTLFINGESWVPTWTSLTGWTVTLSAPAGTNIWTVSASNRLGQPVGATNQVRIVNTAVPDSPVGNVVFSEILFTPAIPGAEYIELFNRSTSTPFDLSGWRVNGLAYTFPSGSLLRPRAWLVLAKSTVAAAAAYGPLTPVFDEFAGGLQANGETLSLVWPGIAPAPDMIVDRVRYETNAPWSLAAALQPGTALQLVDAAQDNSRAGNWTAGRTNSQPLAPQWVYFWTNGTATASRLYLYLGSAGDIYLDDLKLVSGNVPEIGANLVTNGDFESNLTGSWNLSANFSQSALSTGIKHFGSSSLHMIASSAGSGSGSAVYQEITPALTVGAPYTVSFWYRQTTNGGPLVVRLSSSTPTTGLYASAAPVPPASALGLRTPGASNSVASVLPAFPPLWLNEVQPVNLTGPADDFGERDPWLELYNAGTNTQSLAGLYLGTNYNNPTLWTFPPTATVAPGQFLVIWCDGQLGQNTGSVLHTSFRLNGSAGSVVLSRFVTNALQTVDYLNYSGLAPNYSYGDVPDGQPFYRQSMFRASAGSTNDTALPAITIFINEWMADNTDYLFDPATAKYDDWFELYNPTDTAAELGGYYLTDTVTNQFQYQIPEGYRVPPQGFRLVWADGKPSANSTNSPDLHVPFKLDKEGEAIGLFAPDGTAIDAVVFGAQSENVTEGRYPDGGALRVFMPTPSPRAPNLLPPASAPPSVTILSFTPDNQFLISFQTSPGHTYRVEYKNDLNAPSWLPLGDRIFATSSEMMAADMTVGIAQRFYRIVQVD